MSDISNPNQALKCVACTKSFQSSAGTLWWRWIRYFTNYVVFRLGTKCFVMQQRRKENSFTDFEGLHRITYSFVFNHLVWHYYYYLCIVVLLSLAKKAKLSTKYFFLTLSHTLHLNTWIYWLRRLYFYIGFKHLIDYLKVTFSAYEGEITALLGHNGAGKTTTMSGKNRTSTEIHKFLSLNFTFIWQHIQYSQWRIGPLIEANREEEEQFMKFNNYQQWTLVFPLNKMFFFSLCTRSCDRKSEKF